MPGVGRRARRLAWHAVVAAAEAGACVFALRRAEGACEGTASRAARRKEALELNDQVVQGLVVARASFELGDHAGGMKALDATLDRAKKLVTDLLGEQEREGGVHSSFVREHPAAVTK